MTNIKLKGNKEIDLLAIDPKTGNKYHVESRVSTSPSFKLKVKDTKTKKGRPHKIGLDYFVEKKFDHADVTAKVKEAFGESDYDRVLVVWDIQDGAVVESARAKGIHILLMPTILVELITRNVDLPSMKHYLPRGQRDDVLRTIELMALALAKGKPKRATKGEIDFSSFDRAIKRKLATMRAHKQLRPEAPLMQSLAVTSDFTRFKKMEKVKKAEKLLMKKPIEEVYLKYLKKQGLIKPERKGKKWTYKLYEDKT